MKTILALLTGLLLVANTSTAQILKTDSSSSRLDRLGREGVQLGSNIGGTAPGGGTIVGGPRPPRKAMLMVD